MMIPIMLGVSIIIFILKTVTPGDPVDGLLPETATEEQRQEKRIELGLDKPVLVQFLNYVTGVARGDLGVSYRTKRPITEELLQRLPTSLKICFGAVFIGLLLGVPLGIVSALKHYSWLDSVVLVFSMIAASTPGFCLALVLIVIFAVNLDWLPAVGIMSPLGYILPMTTIGISSLSQYTRITRSSMLEVIRQDYIRTARAKGQTETAITFGHALRNAFIPVAAAIGNQVGHQLGGALIVETVFGVPGVGKYIADAISSRNYPAVQGGVLMLAALFTIVNLLVDVSFVLINPRLRTSMLQGRVSMFGRLTRRTRSAAA
jgi:peptide/nickel transport system permease protein